MVEETNEPQAEPFGPEDDIGEIAYQHARNLNGVEVNRSERENDIDEAGRRNIALTREYYDGLEEDINMEEDPMERRHRYLNSRMEEVSEPDEWVQLHYGDREEFDHERMLAFPEANQQRLANAINSLRARREATEAEGNWEDAANYTRAINEVESLRVIA